MTETKFMVVFEEAMRRARKETRDIERFELQMRDFFRVVMGMKSNLGEWKEEDIAYNRPTLLGNIRSLDEDDMNALRRLYNRDDLVFMDRQCQLGEDGRVSDEYCRSARPGLLRSWQKRVHGWVTA